MNLNKLEELFERCGPSYRSDAVRAPVSPSEAMELIKMGLAVHEALNAYKEGAYCENCKNYGEALMHEKLTPVAK